MAGRMIPHLMLNLRKVWEKLCGNRGLEWKYLLLVVLFLFLLSSGKAAVPSAPTVALQSVFPWTGDAVHSITDEGLYMHCEVTAVLSSYDPNL